jgi:hypothetical protein
MKYRKKPVIIDAVLWNGTSRADSELKSIGDGGRAYSRRGDHIGDEYLIIHTLEGDMRADFGDFIIRGIKGELYPCKPDIFEATYEKVEE